MREANRLVPRPPPPTVPGGRGPPGRHPEAAAAAGRYRVLRAGECALSTPDSEIGAGIARTGLGLAGG